VIVVDTGVLYAFFVATDPAHTQAAELLRGETEGIIVSPYVVSELDHFITKNFGPEAEVRVLDSLTSAPFELPAMGAVELIACARVLEEYPDHRIGVTDASLVVLADRYGTRRIGTYDRRHFSFLKPLRGGWFELLPA
jgi:predicted nucleic acid-binding protein